MSEDYQKIIAQLEYLKGYCENRASESGEEYAAIWTPNIQALQEAMDIISDYETIVSNINSLIQKYEQTAKPKRISEKVYVCPECGKRIQPNHSRCHWCGKKVGWK